MSRLFLRPAAFALFLLLAWPAGARAVDLAGCWTGSWESCSTGHRGPLIAEFVPCGDSQYQVYFRGRFLKLVPFQYSVTMTAQEQDGVVYLSGSQYLGRIFGTFSFNASASDACFSASYESCKDNGRFELSRCGTSGGK